MIISTEKKIVVYLVPRTGTFSLNSLFANTGLNLYACNHDHKNYADLAEIEPNLDLSSYRHFSFYREPFDRAVSIVNYLRRGRQCSKFFHLFYGDAYPVSCAGRESYQELSDELKQANDAVPMIEVFRKFRWFFEQGAYGKTQKRWLNFPQVELLNFHDYDNELDRLLRVFDLDPTTVHKPKMNSSLFIPELDTLTADEEQEIRDYLKEDYDFFESRNIHFA